jgi:tyrosine-protein phosphatase YwqE
LISFFKSKPKLFELIPENYVDIHSHILFGLDDGAKTILETEFLLQSMIDLKFTKVITTPHTMTYVWENTNEIINQKYIAVKESLTEQVSKLNLEVASEYLMDDGFVKLFKSKPLLTLKDNYVIVEMSYLNPPIQLYDIIFELQLAGYIPILAHPERYNFYHNSFDNYKKLKKAGCYFQINLLSTVGYYGKDVAETAQKLLQLGMIDFAGSDIHHKSHVAAFYNKLIIKDSKSLINSMNNNSIFR